MADIFPFRAWFAHGLRMKPTRAEHNATGFVCKSIPLFAAGNRSGFKMVLSSRTACFTVSLPAACPLFQADQSGWWVGGSFGLWCDAQLQPAAASQGLRPGYRYVWDYDRLKGDCFAYRLDCFGPGGSVYASTTFDGRSCSSVTPTLYRPANTTGEYDTFWTTVYYRNGTLACSKCCH